MPREESRNDRVYFCSTEQPLLLSFFRGEEGNAIEDFAENYFTELGKTVFMQAGALMAQIMAQEASEREIAQGRNIRTLPPSGGLPFEREWAELREAEFTRRYAMPRELMLSLFQRCLKAIAWKKQKRRSHIPE